MTVAILTNVLLALLAFLSSLGIGAFGVKWLSNMAQGGERVSDLVDKLQKRIDALENDAKIYSQINLSQAVKIAILEGRVEELQHAKESEISALKLEIENCHNQIRDRDRMIAILQNETGKKNA